MANASPIDYAQTRKTLVQALIAATGLGPNQVIRAEGQGPIQPRPKLPYITFKYRTAAMRNGYDALISVPAPAQNIWKYVGERGIAIDINAFGRDQDEAYSLALCVQTGFQQEPIQNILAQSGLSLWTLGDVTDLTALLSTGFEGRALLECEIWQGTSVTVDLGEVAVVNVQGNIEDDTGHGHTTFVSAKLQP